MQRSTRSPLSVDRVGALHCRHALTGLTPYPPLVHDAAFCTGSRLSTSDTELAMTKQNWQQIYLAGEQLHRHKLLHDHAAGTLANSRSVES